MSSIQRVAFTRIHELAFDQFGYFTIEQARKAGVDRRSIWMMCQRETVERVAHGLYRNRLAPTSPLGPYMAAALWPQGDRGVLSHETALELMDLSDVNPGKIHITVPGAYRVRRDVPGQYVIHHADLDPREIISVEGIPVTTVARTIRDGQTAHLGTALLRQALLQGQARGYVTQREAEVLDQELFGIPFSP